MEYYVLCHVTTANSDGICHSASFYSLGISHTSLHQNLPPGFSATMPAPLQPVLPLPQDPSAQLVVLPTEPASHPATHHLGMLKSFYVFLYSICQFYFVDQTTDFV